MTTPAYDITIKADKRGRIWARSHTILGEVILHGLENRHKMGNLLELKMTPEVFFAEAPRNTRIGITNPQTKEVQLVALGPVH